VVDHIIPLSEGGRDDPSNMQWPTKEEANAKDRTADAWPAGAPHVSASRSIGLIFPGFSPIHSLMGTRLALALLWLAVSCSGCASSGVIRGTLSAGTPTGSVIPAQEPKADRASVRGSVVDAVVYVEGVRLRGESRLPAGQASPRLELKGETFRPRILVVPAGTSVEFPNHDSLFHNIFSVSPAKSFDLGRYGRGESKRVTFDKPGLVNVYCKLHPNMAAYVLVVPNRAFARPDSTGRFVLPPLPKGRYVLNVWHPDFPAIRREVAVTGDKKSELVMTLGP